MLKTLYTSALVIVPSAVVGMATYYAVGLSTVAERDTVETVDRSEGQKLNIETHSSEKILSEKLPRREPDRSTSRTPNYAGSQRIPDIFVGSWCETATSSGDDEDSGPMEISSNGFFHYEIDASVLNVTQDGPNTFSILFSAYDDASEDLFTFKEIWSYDKERDQLREVVSLNGFYSSVLKRC